MVSWGINVFDCMLGKLLLWVIIERFDGMFRFRFLVVCMVLIVNMIDE